MLRADIKPDMLRWARERAGFGLASLAKRFPKLTAWESGDSSPTLKQLESYAKATYVPVGYLFLPEPPKEQAPIPDLRTLGSEELAQPSPDLLDTIYLCQQRQGWYCNFARWTHQDPLPFVGKVALQADVRGTAEEMRRSLGFDLEARANCPTWTDALRVFIEQADELGILVMVSGVVGNNNRRKLDVEEFRGFALADRYAPLVFINGADTKAAQMFTLAHELAHVWLGESALSDVGAATLPGTRIEGWCNRVAAELLVPLAVIREQTAGDDAVLDRLSELTRYFKVSSLVVLRRLLDAGRIDRGEFGRAYAAELTKFRDAKTGSTGGNFYYTQAARVSKRFGRALVSSVLEGQTLYRDAFRMLGIKREQTFREFGRNLGYPI